MQQGLRRHTNRKAYSERAECRYTIIIIIIIIKYRDTWCIHDYNIIVPVWVLYLPSPGTSIQPNHSAFDPSLIFVKYYANAVYIFHDTEGEQNET